MIRYFICHPTAANLLMLVIILLGFFGLNSLTREVFPEFASESINIRVIYRGASAEEVEETICQRIEEEIEGIEGIARIVATARENSGFLTLEVADGHRLRDVLTDVENAVEQIDDFPEDVEDPVIWEWDRIERVCTVTLSADEMSDKDLVALSKKIKGELLDLDGISLVESSGFSEHQIRVEVREEALLALGLTIDDVAREIRSGSIDLPAGSVETGRREINIRVMDQRRTAEEFRDLTIEVSPAEVPPSSQSERDDPARQGGSLGAKIPLRAIATVTDTFEDTWLQTTFEGRRCVNLEVNKTSDEDSIRVKDVVDAYIAECRASLPPGLHLTVWGDWSIYVKDRLGMLVENGFFGFILVFLTLWAMLHLRIAFWVAIGIPISFLGTLFVMDQVDLTLNMITMFSLILAVGIIVDDAIVIGENIFAHYARGASPVEAAVEGTKEVAVGVTASMLTTVAIFMPLLAMAGDTGKMLRVMPIAVITALAVSLVEGFFILPNHLRHSMEKIPKEPSRVRKAVERSIARFTQEVYGPVLDWSARRPLVILAGVLMMFAIAMGMLAGGRLKFQLLPQLDGDFLLAQIELPHGTDITHTKQIVDRIEEALKVVDETFAPRQPAGTQLIQHVSTTFGFSRDMGDTPGLPETGSHIAQVMVELLDGDRRDARCDEILEVWQREVGEVAGVVSLIFEQMAV